MPQRHTLQSWHARETKLWATHLSTPPSQLHAPVLAVKKKWAVSTVEKVQGEEGPKKEMSEGTISQKKH